MKDFMAFIFNSIHCQCYHPFIYTTRKVPFSNTYFVTATTECRKKALIVTIICRRHYMQIYEFLLSIVKLAVSDLFGQSDGNINFTYSLWCIGVIYIL